jgi:putative sigma-54 modulation protein
MNIQVRGDHIEVTPALREYAQKKIGRLVKYFEALPDGDAMVTMAVERGLHRVEVTMQVQGVLFRAEVESDDMYASIDLVSDKLEHQILRHKARVNQRFRNSGVRTRIRDVEAAKPGAAAADAGVDEPKVVRVKRFPIKPMAVEEAVLQMELLGHDFYVFTNAETDETNVVYRRKDGNYGLIEPTV